MVIKLPFINKKTYLCYSTACNLTDIKYLQLGDANCSYFSFLNFFTAMDTPDSRYYIGTDHNGSPMAVFDSKGRLVKELTRSPFGQIIRDTNPSMDLSVDFAGGLIDQYTHLIHLGDRVYDPVLGQWMTPLWTKVANPGAMKSPFDVFCYRFHSNDPINLNKKTRLMTGNFSHFKIRKNSNFVKKFCL